MSAREAFGEKRWRELVADTAYYIDKNCTGGIPEDWVAAEQIIESLYRAGLLTTPPSSILRSGSE